MTSESYISPMNPALVTKSPPILYMGPIRGGTDHIYRNTFARHFSGFDLAVAPFINCVGANKIRPKYVRGLWPENNTRIPVIPQILSKSADGFVNLGNFLADLGYDTVNWNLGCPFPQVANKLRGSGLLPYPDKIREFLDGVLPKLKARLSIKTRLGREHREEIFALMPVFNDYPLAEIIIHPRTGRQMYDGTVDLDTFETCLTESRHIVVYNGDIRTVADFTRLSERFPDVERWMIGRYALVDPFLPAAIKAGKNDAENKKEKMKAFHDDLYDAYSRTLNGPAHFMDRMKGLMVSFVLAFAENKAAEKAVKKARTPDQYRTAADRFFAETEWGL